MTYKFDEKLHAHTLDDKPLHGVTTVLSVISKPALIQWAANMAVGYIEERLMSHPVIDEDDPSNILTWWMIKDKKTLEEAKKAHRMKKEKAGDWGTLLHRAIEEYIKNKTMPSLDEMGMNAFNYFQAWALENKVEFLESEKHVWSREMWIGGIVDGVLKMDGKKYIFDIKTSSNIYNEHFFQMAAYEMCLKEMGEYDDVEGYIVINLKKDGTMDLKRADNMQVNREAFLAALTLHKIINSLE